MYSEELVLRVQNVSKCFEMYDKPVHRLFQTLCAGKKQFYKEFWALRDINFEVKKGECIGVIGKNGAGKSTLLQILVGTLQPTTGSVEVKGRVAALLELGSGFNPEFTGRENVYMNAAILGLSKQETDAKFQEIVDFADIGEFVDQPVKTYSSGMMVRLAFAVQVMVEPDILIVDEALAVGDAAFQRKCYTLLAQRIKDGMTLFLVTHDLSLIRDFTSRAIYLKNRSVAFIGPSAEGMLMYQQDLFGKEDETQTPKTITGAALPEYGDGCVRLSPRADRSFGTGGVRVKEILLFPVLHPNILQTPQTITAEITIEWDAETVLDIARTNLLEPNLCIGCAFSNTKGYLLFGANSSFEGIRISPESATSAVVSFCFELPRLPKGDVFFTYAVHIGVYGCDTIAEWQNNSIQLVSHQEYNYGDVAIVAPAKVHLKQ